MYIDSQTIKALRKKLGFSQTEFGELFGITQTAIGSWENGKNQIPKSAIDYIKQNSEKDENWDIDKIEDRYFDRPKENESTSSITAAALEELRSTLEFMKAQIIELQEEKRWMRSLVDSYKATSPLGKTKGLIEKDGILIPFYDLESALISA